MFVEGDVEITIKDNSTLLTEDHERKLWIQGAFRGISCYRISGLKELGRSTYQVTVAIKLSECSTEERENIISHSYDKDLLKSFIAGMFVGKGTIRCVSDPVIKDS